MASACCCWIEAVAFKQQQLKEVLCEVGGGRVCLPSYGAGASRQQQQQAAGSLVSTSQSLQWSSTTPHRRRLSQQPIASGMVRKAAALSSSTHHDAAVSLESVVGVSYELLRDKLAGGEWEMADAETRRLLCVLAGEAAAKRKWVYFSEVQFIPSADLRTIDGLWRAHSNHKFGYSIQRSIWKSADRNWSVFFRKVGWTRALDEKNEMYASFPSEFMWDLDDPTPKGHLPLTNALRGTQLLEKILSHPAFDDADQENEIDLNSTSFNTFF